MGKLQKRLSEVGPQRRRELIAGGTVAVVAAFALLYVSPSATSAQQSEPTANHHHPGGKKPPTKTTPKPPPDHHKTKHRLPRGHMLAVGDSVMKGCASALRAALRYRVYVDAMESRQIDETITDVEHYRATGRLPKIVIVQVGNNGPLISDDLARLKAALRGVPDIVFVNVRNGTTWQDESNNELTQFLEGWHVAHLADWYHHSTNSMLYPDGTHPLPQYCPVYARVIATTLRATNS